MVRGGFESFEKRNNEELEKQGLRDYGLTAKGAEGKANPAIAENQDNLDLKNKNSEKQRDTEKNIVDNSFEKSYETSVKKGIENAREAEKNDPENRPPVDGGETQANLELESGLNLAWP